METCETPLVTGHTIRHRSDVTPFTVHLIHPLCLTCEPVAYPTHDVFIQLSAGHLVQKDPVRDSIKIFTEIQKGWFVLLCVPQPASSKCVQEQASGLDLGKPDFLLLLCVCLHTCLQCISAKK